MEQLRYGLFPYPPYLYPIGKSDLGGYLSAAYKAMNYYVLEKFNITFVANSPRSGAYCDQVGNCYKALRDLQLGKVDVQGYYGTFFLSSTPVNLTLTAPVVETKCYLFYKPDVRVNLSSEYFFDFIHLFEPIFWLLLITLVTIFFILFKYLQIYKINSWWQLIWTIGGTTLGQFNFQPVGQLSRQCVYILVFLGFLLLGSIFSASMQTGLKSTIDFVKLESLDDAIGHNYTVAVVDTVTCRTLFDPSSTLDSVKYISQRLVLINATNKLPYEVFKNGTAPGKLIVDDNLQYLRMRQFSCWYNRQRELASPIYISKHSVYKVGNVGVYHSGVNRRTSRLLDRLSYAAFETGCSDNSQIKKLGLFSIFHHKELSSCMANQFKGDSIITSAISLYYLMLPTIILYTGHLISLVIFILAHWST